MGNVNTTVGKSVVTNINNIITDISSNAIADSKGNTSTNNNATVLFGDNVSYTDPEGGVIDCKGTNAGNTIQGGINVDQKNITQFNINTQASINAAIQVKNQLSSQVNQYLSSANDNEKGWLSIALNVNTSDQTAVASSINNITTNIDTDAKTSCANFDYTDNTVTIVVCGPVLDGVNVNQANAVLVASSCSAKVVFKAIAGTKALQDNIAKAEAKYKNVDNGPFAVIEDILYVFAAIIVIIIVISLVMYLFRGKPNRLKEGSPDQYGPPPDQYGQPYGPPDQYGQPYGQPYGPSDQYGPPPMSN